MKNWGRLGEAALSVAVVAWFLGSGVNAAGGPVEAQGGPYRVLAPIESGNLLLFPVVRADGRSTGDTPFITLDEGLKSGDVEVTEAGRARGLVRPRGPQAAQDNYDRGDEVNTLVLVNHSKRPLLLLAGEIVTGGKQDRIVAKDRIVPADADPIDLWSFLHRAGPLDGELGDLWRRGQVRSQELYGAASSAREGDGRPGPAAGMELGGRCNLAYGSRSVAARQRRCSAR